MVYSLLEIAAENSLLRNVLLSSCCAYIILQNAKNKILS